MTGERDKTIQAARIIIGHCPTCRGVLAVVNNYETWPLVYCGCGWVGATTEITGRVRFERDGLSSRTS